MSTRQPVDPPAAFPRSTSRRVGLTDPPSTALASPGSTRVSCLLMQDAVAANAVSAAGSRAGSMAGKVALFSNPYLDGKEEALVVDAGGRLTYLRREATETGWLQSPVTGGGREALAAGEVVVVVHARDLSVWALYTPGATGAPQALQLVASTKSGVTSCDWRAVPGAIVTDSGHAFTGLSHLYVFYDNDRFPVVTGIDSGTGCVVVLRALTNPGSTWFAQDVLPVSFSANGPVDDLVAGRVLSTTVVTEKPWAPTVYLRFGAQLVRYLAASTAEQPGPIAADVASIVGVYHSYGGTRKSGVGCVYLDTDGNLVTWNEAGEHPSVVSSTPGLGFVTAASWLDVNQMLHVYGLDATNTLKVLHQVAWGRNGVPVWSHSTVIKTAAADPVIVPSCLGLVSKVAAFVLDPFPDTLPNQLVKKEGTATPDEQFSFYTQDINSVRWSRDKVRLPSAGTPHLATHYVSSVTVMDRRGTPMPGLTVKVSAETLAEIQVDGASYLVGPGHSVSLATNAFGAVNISTPADSLLPATLHVEASGLEHGAIVQPAAAVHDYLGGSGTLPSQRGLFTADALRDARVDGAPIVDPKHDKSIDGVVTGVHQVFALADGKPLTSKLFRGAGPAPAIHGFAVGPAPGSQLGRGASHVQYTEFASPQAAEAHLAAIRAMPEYGGIWEDFGNWAGDVWQGIKDGAIQVVDFYVAAVSTVFIKIGEWIVELVGIVIDTVESAVHTAEAVFREVVESIGKVVDWLKSLFAFKDIWDTKRALESGTGTMLSYGAATVEHFGNLSADWFERQRAEVTRYFEDLKVQYAGRPLGDARNQIPTLTDASGHGLDPRAARDDPQASWLLNQTFAGPALAAARAAAPAAFADSPISTAFSAFLDTLTETGIGASVERILGDLDVVVTGVIDPRDPDGAAKASMIALVDIMEQLTLVVLQALDRVVAAVVAVVRAVADHAADVLNYPLSLGPVNTIYEWIQTQNGIVQPEELTLGGLVFLIAGFAITTSYKLVNGVEAAPFPGGAFPALPAPPWHPAHDPQPTAASYEDVKDTNAHLKNLQVACGFAGGFGAVFDGIGDLVPVLPRGQDWGPTAQLVVALCSTILTATMFGAVSSCPPVTGTAWDDADGAWSAAFAVSVVSVALSFGAMHWNRTRGGDTPILKNVGLVVVGPILVTALSACYLGFSGSACDKSKTNSYTTAVIILSGIPGVVQLLRIRSNSPVSKERAGIVALIDVLAIEASAFMLGIGAGTTRAPYIPDQKLPAGTVGKSYADTTITAYGGDKVYNAPLKGWSVSVGALPAGLQLDATTG
ncbi:MAG: hypothetical protein ACLPZR_10830, partial [Solirubrobacteraceae bacterium]